jgi:biopolymer transport protein ExbB
MFRFSTGFKGKDRHICFRYSGRADVALLSGGIWGALLTTAFGLLIAIPSLLAHHYFSRLAGGRSDYMELLISHLNALTGKMGV